MCGIFGYISTLPAKDKSQLRPIIEEIGAMSMERGTDAHGIAFFDEIGSMTVTKNKGRVSNLFKGDEWKNLVMPDILIGHTRAATQGHPEQNENNHPLTIGDFTVLHNGGIVNDMDITKRLDLVRYAEVDSEVIPSLISKTAKDNPQLENVEILEKCLGELVGSHACAMLDQREPNSLYLWRSYSPCALALVPSLNTLFFASSTYYLAKALNKHDFIMGGIAQEQGVIITNSGGSLVIEDFFFTNKYHNMQEYLMEYRKRNAALMKEDDSVYGLN